MCLGAINSAVSKEKYFLIMQMSKFKLGTVEKNHHQLQVLREKPNLCFCEPCVEIPLTYQKICPGQVSDEIQPPPPLRNLAPLLLKHGC